MSTLQHPTTLKRQAVQLPGDLHAQIADEADSFGGIPHHRLVKAMFSHWSGLTVAEKADALRFAGRSQDDTDPPPDRTLRIPAGETHRVAA